MTSSERDILKELVIGTDGIYGYPFQVKDQLIEVELREKVVNVRYDNYLKEISSHHSVPVMDKEVSRFLNCIPLGGKISMLEGVGGGIREM